MSFDIKEFITGAEDDEITETVEETQAEEEIDVETQVDIQKAALEELAADKAQLDEKIGGLQAQNEELGRTVEVQKEEIEKLKESVRALHAEAETLKSELAQEKAGEKDTQVRNPNALALLDRDVELPDRFPGESRDHVIEVLVEAREHAEKDGRVRRAQILEGVLVANEPNGTLKTRREELKKLFTENSNILNGQVIEELGKLGISHKNGEEYLLPDEILKRSY